MTNVFDSTRLARTLERDDVLCLQVDAALLELFGLSTRTEL